MITGKDEWVLRALAIAPLDRVRLMKVLFRLWWHSGKAVPNFFSFRPYLYGPWSPEVYESLERLEKQGFVVRLPHPIPARSKYHLTDRGRRAVQGVISTINERYLDLLQKLTCETANLGFYELLKLVYNEAPEFAQNSVVREVLRNDADSCFGSK